MSAQLVYFTQDVEQEWLNVKIKSLVIEEKLGNQAQVLRINLMLFAVSFVN